MQHLVRLPTEQTARLSRASKTLEFQLVRLWFYQESKSRDQPRLLLASFAFHRPRWAAGGDKVLYKRTVEALYEIGAVAMMGGDGVLAA